VLTADRILVLTSPTFDYAALYVPAVRYLGPNLDEPGWAEPPTHPCTSDQRPLVLVGLSSTFQNQAALLQRIIDAIATLPVRAIVTTGPAIDPGELVAAGDVRVVRSAAHGPLIDQAAAVVTHCGHGTTLKSLAAGVPMVCIPMGRDQDDTAARVVYHGAGVRLSPTASARTIRVAVTKMLERDEYRAAANKLATAITHECDSSTHTAELESLARTREIRVDGERPRQRAPPEISLSVRTHRRRAQGATQAERSAVPFRRGRRVTRPAIRCPSTVPSTSGRGSHPSRAIISSPLWIGTVLVVCSDATNKRCSARTGRHEAVPPTRTKRATADPATSPVTSKDRQ
jgi:UDP-N-acetylglucosamine transferase subunit ALG13